MQEWLAVSRRDETGEEISGGAVHVVMASLRGMAFMHYRRMLWQVAEACRLRLVAWRDICARRSGCRFFAPVGTQRTVSLSNLERLS